jgi:hypothetical protein
MKNWSQPKKGCFRRKRSQGAARRGNEWKGMDIRQLLEENTKEKAIGKVQESGTE